MLGYYRQLILMFSSIAQFLTEATKLKSNTKLTWSETMEEAFATLKDTPCRHTKLMIPSQEDKFLLYTDTSGDGNHALILHHYPKNIY